MDGPGTSTSDSDSGLPGAASRGLWRRRVQRTKRYATLAARQDGPFPQSAITVSPQEAAGWD